MSRDIVIFVIGLCVGGAVQFLFLYASIHFIVKQLLAAVQPSSPIACDGCGKGNFTASRNEAGEVESLICTFCLREL